MKLIRRALVIEEEKMNLKYKIIINVRGCLLELVMYVVIRGGGVRSEIRYEIMRTSNGDVGDYVNNELIISSNFCVGAQSAEELRSSR